MKLINPQYDDNMNIEKLIEYADSLLPGEPTDGPEGDVRWGAMHEIECHIEEHHEKIWQFIRKWGVHPHEDTRMGIACCLLEHLLEYHFEAYIGEVETLAMEDQHFAQTFSYCSKFGQSKDCENSKRFDSLINQIRK